MIVDYFAKVVDKKQLNDTVYEIGLSIINSLEMEWISGQYILLRIGNNLSRSYSIANVPNSKKNVTICVDTKPSGPGSIYVKNLKIGDKVKFKGPLGKFTLNYELPARIAAQGVAGGPTMNYVFVATGVGIAPFKAMIPELLDKINNQFPIPNVQLLWGLRHESETYYRDFWEDLENIYPNFCYKYVFSKTGYHVTDVVKKEKRTQYYVCGNMGMIKDVMKIVGPVHHESFFGD